MKHIVGLVEKVIVYGGSGSKEVLAKVDTGADRCSIDSELAAELRLGPVIKTKSIRSAHGNSLRLVVSGEIVLAGSRIRCSFTVADRRTMRYPVLVGKDVLRKNEFLIDPCKK